MTKNVGLFDRTMRLWVGVALILFAVMSPDKPYAYFGWLGLIPFITAMVGWCGIYKLFGISTVRNP